VFSRPSESLALWKIRRAKLRNDVRFANRLIEARATKRPQSEIQEILDTRFAEAEDLDFARALIETLQLIGTAQDLRVPTPPMTPGSSDWVDSPNGGTVLTDTGAARLREDVRGELMARWNLQTRWVPVVCTVIGALTGLLGVVVAIMALASRGAN
jgi:hypothetical protein